MARKVRASGFETRTARLKRSVAKKPEFVRIAPGVSLGYRRNATAGTWVARVADGRGGNWTKGIGTADDHDDANGDTVLDYWQASDRAKQVARGGKDQTAEAAAAPQAVETVTTLCAALDRYEADLRTRGGDEGNAVRVRRHLTAAMLDRSVVSLSLKALRDWRDGLTAKRRRKPGDAEPEAPGEPLTPSGVNRLCTALKAALNLAADLDDRIISRRAWEQGLATLPGAEEARNVVLADSDIRKLIVAAPTQGADFGLLVEGLAVTGARVSQLARTNVRDLQDDRPDPRIQVPSSAKGRGTKAVLRRPVPISADFAARLREAAEGRAADGPLFPKGAGRWKDTDHARPFAKIVKAAEIKTDDGEPVTSYALRHSSIVRALLVNVPVRVVASQHDTSVAMIERNYSRFIADHADAMARAAMFRVAAPSSPLATEPATTV
jgi:integrase